MGRNAEAESQFGSAVELAEKFEPNDTRLPESLTWLAQALSHEGKYVEAEKLYRRTLALYEKTLGPSHETIANLLGAWGANQSRKGDYGEAERLFSSPWRCSRRPWVRRVLGWHRSSVIWRP